jgi:Glycosyltransferase
MAKVYYISGLKFELWGMGIQKKIRNQMNELEKNFGHCEYIFLENPKSKITKYINKIVPYLSNVNYKKADLIDSGSIAYIRYVTIDYSFYTFIKRLNKKNVKILLEIPTYPYNKEVTSIIGKWQLLGESVYISKLYKYIDRIITYSKDQLIFNIPTICISNGIDTKDMYQLSCSPIDSTVNMIAVASLAKWHGYDRVIKGIAEYYANGGKRNVVFHLVGDGYRILEQYKKDVRQLGIENHVIFYGKRTGGSLDDVYHKCTIAIDSLGRHRSGVVYNSSLKGKEYLLKGLPVVSGVKTELDYDLSFKYYLRVPADETAVDINSIIKFFDYIYTSGRNRKEIQEEIRMYAIKNFSYEVAFLPVIRYMKSI